MKKLSLMFAALAGLFSQSSFGHYRKLPSREQSKERENENLLKFYQRNGVKEYSFNGTVIYARDLKNANRKYENLVKS